MNLAHTYQSVSCDLHSRLELAVMRRLLREWVWDEGGGERRLWGVARDVQTRDGAEWLLLADEKGATCWLRLDWLKTELKD